MNVVYLSGGVGGARLLEGLSRAVPAASLTAIVNVGDDFSHWGLRICPDLDTVLYTLAGLADPQRGWGLRKETFRTLAAVQRFGGEDWFRLGDGDLATHLMRTQWLGRGETLTTVTSRLARALGVPVAVLPMTDGRFETHIQTVDDGTLSFQDWLVRRGGVPAVARVLFRGEAAASEEVVKALLRAELIVIGPSNPYVSIDPILTLPGVREGLSGKPVVAVSPIVDGRAIKGPLPAMIEALAHRPASAGAVAAHYGELLGGFVVEDGDEVTVQGVPCLPARTVMKTRQDRLQLARAVLSFAERMCC
jgi:LPPG:FO 2-phospho-L-lactate transferase